MDGSSLFYWIQLLHPFHSICSGWQYPPKCLWFKLLKTHEQHGFSSSQLLRYISLSSWNHTQVLEGTAQVLTEKKNLQILWQEEESVWNWRSAHTWCILFPSRVCGIFNSIILHHELLKSISIELKGDQRKNKNGISDPTTYQWITKRKEKKTWPLNKKRHELLE
jgi:hypothetical protein